MVFDRYDKEVIHGVGILVDDAAKGKDGLKVGKKKLGAQPELADQQLEMAHGLAVLEHLELEAVLFGATLLQDTGDSTATHIVVFTENMERVHWWLSHPPSGQYT
eukprot:gene14869-4413_t